MSADGNEPPNTKGAGDRPNRPPARRGAKPQGGKSSGYKGAGGASAGKEAWQKRPGGGAASKFGDRKPFVRRDDTGGERRGPPDGERKSWVKREGGTGDGPRKFGSSRNSGPRKPLVRRDDTGGERRGPPDGERKPWVKREGGAEGPRKFDGPRKPFRPRDDGGGERRGPPDGERKPWVKRESGADGPRKFDGPRKPFRPRDDAVAERRGPPDGERKPWVKREGGGDARHSGPRKFASPRSIEPKKPFKPREDVAAAAPSDRAVGPRIDAGSDAKPWVKREPLAKRDYAGDRPTAPAGAKKPFNPKQRPDKRRPAEPPRGMEAREEAVELIEWVISKKRALDDALARSAKEPGLRKLKPNDRGFARMMAATALRRHGQIAAVFADFMENPLDKQSGHTTAILHAAAAQVLFLATPSHAAVSIAVEQAKANPASQRYEKMVNALLRRVVTEGPAIIAEQDQIALNIPDWMMARWTSAYGPELARRIAAASLSEAPLDISVKSDPERWAKELGGELLPTGTVRLAGGGRIDHMPGFAEGEWWVQDAAAALPVKLLGDVKGLRVADLCAAPGGKTMELAARGAKVTAVDISKERLDRVRANLARVKLSAETVVADVLTWVPPDAFDAVLLDVPCTATGTIRRHPDILHIKRETDLASIVETQGQLLRAASRLVKPGGLMVYCSCSLEPQEGQEQIGRFLATASGIETVPVSADEIGGLIECITPKGHLRTLPCHLDRGNPAQSGLDGFFAARMKVGG